MTGAGAGRIGEYERCSFTSAEGVGSFTPPADGQPLAGAPGEPSSPRKSASRWWLRAAARGECVAAARAAHPYEEPLIVAADVRSARSSARMGMLCAVAEATHPAGLADVPRGASSTSTPVVWGDPERCSARVATATGSAGSLIGDVIASGAQALDRW